MKDVEDAEEVEDRDSVAESRLARKVASFGIVAGHYYTPRRRFSEDSVNLFGKRRGWWRRKSDITKQKVSASITRILPALYSLHLFGSKIRSIHTLFH